MRDIDAFDFEQRFSRLEALLYSHQHLWRSNPFHDSALDAPSWITQAPQFYDFILGLSYDQVLAYKSDTQALIKDATPYLGTCTQLSELTSLTSLVAVNTVETHFSGGIPGRKWQQISSFADAINADSETRPWLEWCAGKGFLGRVLSARSHQHVTSIEYQSVLCELGEQEALSLQLPMTFVNLDVFEAKIEKHIHSEHHAVALHACGDLHVRLVELAAKHQVSALSFSPCCYHLIKGDCYRPLSQLGRRSCLRLSKQDLRIPLQQTVTGGQRVSHARQQEMTYRLGLDLIWRDAGSTTYVPVPSIKKSQLNDGFEAFCRWASREKAIPLLDVDFDDYLQRGMQRFFQMERLSLSQQIFQRALELWLVLDKVLFLEQHGYRIEMSHFCNYQTTPRNILVKAVLEN